jgi:hypothetical protein
LSPSGSCEREEARPRRGEAGSAHVSRTRAATGARLSSMRWSHSGSYCGRRAARCLGSARCGMVMMRAPSARAATMRGSAMMGEEVASGFEGIEGNGHRMAQKRGKERGRRPFGPPPSMGASAPEGSHLGGGGFLLDRGVAGGLVGFPVFSGEVLVGVDGAMGRA